MDRVRKRIGLEDLSEWEWKAKPVTVAVLDSGIVNHPDLVGKCMVFKDFVNQRKTSYDDSGHGTHVCGILCGSGESSQGKYRGITPACRLIVCKVLDDKGNGNADTMIEALKWLWECRKVYDIRIINISVGIGHMQDKKKLVLLTKWLEKLWDSGILIVCAAGNKGPRPGSISNVGGLKKVLTVGCYDDLETHYDKDNCQHYSGRGPKSSAFRKPDIVAPGTGIVSCHYKFKRLPYLKGKEHPQINGYIYENLYIPKSGTSMATPMVSGAGALLWQREPYLSNVDIAQRLKFSAQDLGIPWNSQGWGMLNIKNLLEIPGNY